MSGKEQSGRAVAEVDHVLLVAFGSAVATPVDEARQVLVMWIVDFVGEDATSDLCRESSSSRIGACVSRHHADPIVAVVWH